MTREELIQGIVQNAKYAHQAQKEPYTFCQLFYGYKDVDYIGDGFSKMRPGDVWNPELGEVKARGRAVSDIYQQIRAAEEEEK